MVPVARFFKQEELLIWFPLMQPFHIVYTVIAVGWDWLENTNGKKKGEVIVNAALLQEAASDE